MISSSEEGVMMLFGENMALGLMVKALVAAHPNPQALRAVVTMFQTQAAKAIEQAPPPNLQLFRYEQLLEQLVAEIRS